MIAHAAILLLASLAAGAAAEGAAGRLAVPSGDEVWLQETLQDKVPGIGIVERYRFVMPSLATQVPAAPAGDVMADIPPDLLDEPTPQSDAPLSADDQAAVSAALDQLAQDNALADTGGGVSADGQAQGIEALPRLDLPDGSEGGLEPGPAPSDLAAPDAAGEGSGDDGSGDAPPGSDAEAAGDLAAAGDTAPRGGDAGEMPLPAAPDILMQDPVHKDIVWLCEHVALPEIAKMTPRPAQVVISLASAPSEFGTFDPGVVQLFEGFSIPPDRDVCVWEPI